MLKGPTAYRDGWVRVDHPQYPGWVSLANLKPLDGAAAIMAVDRPENCLRIRSGPSSSFPVVECAGISAKLALSGIWSDDNWACCRGKAGLRRSDQRSFQACKLGLSCTGHDQEPTLGVGRRCLCARVRPVLLLWPVLELLARLVLLV